tara:strand:- start:19609 stop:19731 length:123 start_codon:yes stop_codon:yes gene_type:complete
MIRQIARVFRASPATLIEDLLGLAALAVLLLGALHLPGLA